MVANVHVWRKLVEQIVGGIADEAMQRRAWLGSGPEVSSPDEMINGLLGDAEIEHFLNRSDNGLNEQQSEAGWRLVRLVSEFSKQLPHYPQFPDPMKIIDDPGWIEIRGAAAHFAEILSRRGAGHASE
jgi:hypothetical protein